MGKVIMYKYYAIISLVLCWTNGLPLMDPKWKQIKEMDQATWLKHNNPEKVAKHDPQGINLKKEIALLDREISFMEKHIAINGHGPKETKELKKLRHRSEVLAHLLKWVQTGTKPPNMTDTHSTNEGSRAKERIDCKSTAHCEDTYASGNETYASGDETNASGDSENKTSDNDGQEKSSEEGKSRQNKKSIEENSSVEGSADVQTKGEDIEKGNEGSA